MQKSSKIAFILLVTIIFLGSATLALAQMHKGSGYPAGMHSGQGRQIWGCGGPGYGMFGDLSEDQIQQLNEERTAFWEATKSLRQQIYQKRLELASELAKQTPDAAAAAAVQQQISDLMAQLAQKHLEHFLRVQKIDPDAGRGGPMGFGMIGYGMRHHDMMRSGGYGGWGRPDCPVGEPGYGMGPGMMQRHMMGPGGFGPWNRPWGGYGMGPGMMDRDYVRQYHDTQTPPPEKNTAVNKED